MARLGERLATAERAVATLREVDKQSLPPIATRDLRILRFTYTFEAVWKATQSLLDEMHGIATVSPKATVRSARNIGLLSDEDCVVALSMANDRNLAAHVYYERLAEALNSRVDDYAAVLTRWLAEMHHAARGQYGRTGMNSASTPRRHVMAERASSGAGTAARV